jgi:hypothetical protein
MKQIKENINATRKENYINHGLRSASELTNMHWCVENRVGPAHILDGYSYSSGPLKIPFVPHLIA